jgi:GNAT superfamily N-acetyltransferase
MLELILRPRLRCATTPWRASVGVRRVATAYDLSMREAVDTAGIATVGDDDLADLLPLMRGYCSFYKVAPSDTALLALARALIADPGQGMQLLAREQDGTAAGFATIYWSWSTSSAARIGIMNDLYVDPSWRGRRVGERLISACAAECRRVGAVALEWQTAPENVRAQSLYDRVGGRRESWLCYTLPIAAEP